MESRDRFYRMIILMFSLILLLSVLLLGIIFLLLIFSVPAYAAETSYIDSGPPPEQLQEEAPEDFPWFGIPDYGGWIDSGNPLDYEAEEEPLDTLHEDSGTLLEEVTQIRQMLELLICFVVPFLCAVWLVYKFCMWFYYTFIRSVL